MRKASLVLLIAAVLIATPTSAAPASRVVQGNWTVTISVDNGHNTYKMQRNLGRDACPNPGSFSASANYSWKERFPVKVEQVASEVFFEPAEQNSRKVQHGEVFHYTGSGGSSVQVAGGDGCINEVNQCAWHFEPAQSANPLLQNGFASAPKAYTDPHTGVRAFNVHFLTPSPHAKITQAPQAKDDQGLDAEQPVGCQDGTFPNLNEGWDGAEIRLHVPAATFNERKSATYHFQIGDQLRESNELHATLPSTDRGARSRFHQTFPDGGTEDETVDFAGEITFSPPPR